MKNVYRFFKNSKTPPQGSVKRFSSGSGMVSLSEYTNPEVKTFSNEDEVDTGSQIENLQNQINELTATVGKLSEIVSNLKATGKENTPAVSTGSAEEAPKSEEKYDDFGNANGGNQDLAETGNENTKEEALGAEVPGNTGTYTQVPEDEIVSQFSSRSETSAVVMPSLGNKDAFKVLFK